MAENLAESMMNLATSDMGISGSPCTVVELSTSNLPNEPVVLVRKISDDTSGDNDELGPIDENKGNITNIFSENCTYFLTHNF